MLLIILEQKMAGSLRRALRIGLVLVIFFFERGCNLLLDRLSVDRILFREGRSHAHAQDILNVISGIVFFWFLVQNFYGNVFELLSFSRLPISASRRNFADVKRRSSPLSIRPIIWLYKGIVAFRR